MVTFVPGWHPTTAAAAHSRLTFSGRYCTVNSAAPAPRPAVSLSHLRINYYVQGSAGTCFAHSPKQLFEVTGKALGYTPFPACRRLIAWATKAIEDGDNPTNGGSPTDAITVMTSQGVGVAHEDLCPYTDDARVLGQKPPQEVFDNATKSHLQVPILPRSVDDIVRLVDSGHSVANGYACPSTLQDGTTFIRSVGSILGGHSQLIWGYAQPGVFDEYRWLELDNWWDLTYVPLPPSLAKLVEGYEPVRSDRTSSVWMREDIYMQCCRIQGGSEHISATDIDGLTGGLVTPVNSSAFDNIFPV
jgi:hypothetical protein